VVYAQLWGTSYVQIQRTCSLQPKHDVYKTPVLMGSETCPKVGIKTRWRVFQSKLGRRQSCSGLTKGVGIDSTHINPTQLCPSLAIPTSRSSILTEQFICLVDGARVCFGKGNLCGLLQALDVDWPKFRRVNLSLALLLEPKFPQLLLEIVEILLQRKLPELGVDTLGPMSVWPHKECTTRNSSDKYVRKIQFRRQLSLPIRTGVTVHGTLWIYRLIKSTSSPPKYF